MGSSLVVSGPLLSNGVRLEYCEITLSMLNLSNAILILVRTLCQ